MNTGRGRRRVRRGEGAGAATSPTSPETDEGVGKRPHAVPTRTAAPKTSRMPYKNKADSVGVRARGRGTPHSRAGKGPAASARANAPPEPLTHRWGCRMTSEPTPRRAWSHRRRLCPPPAAAPRGAGEPLEMGSGAVAISASAGSAHRAGPRFTFRDGRKRAATLFKRAGAGKEAVWRGFG